jgi:replicative DNA helicase
VGKLEQSPKLLEFLKDRGIEEKTIKRFNLGYDPKIDSLIIPYDEKRYSTNFKPGEYINQRGLEKALYNFKSIEGHKQPIFILDNELDVILLETLGAKAIGIQGRENAKLFINRISKIKGITAPLIIWISESMKEAILTEGLNLINYPYATVRQQEKKEIYITEQYIKEPGSIEGLIAEYITEANGIYEEYQEELKQEITKENTANFIDHMFNEIKATENIKPIETGHNYLDNVIGGGLYPGLYVIGALSSLGKTTFMLQMTDQLCEQGNDVLFFSLEMSRQELIGRSISRLTRHLNKDKNLYKSEQGITVGYKYKSYSEAEKRAIEGAKSHYKERIGHKLYVNEGIGEFGTKEIEARISKHIEITGNKPVVIIDYLQLLINSTDKVMADKQATDRNILELKRISRKYDVIIWAISSFNRDSYQRKLNTGAFKESGAIEYSADVVIGLGYLKIEITDTDKEGKVRVDIAELQDGKGENEVDKKREIVVKILKNRKGKSGKMIRYDYYPFSNYILERGLINKSGNPEDL